ncbi:conserved hypothetical protein [Mesorhizobium sp. ORS 3324]|nr:conserved hypothetical protein [Mesorhizobium sp. ORS 3324]
MLNLTHRTHVDQGCEHGGFSRVQTVGFRVKPAAMLERALPCGQARDRQTRAYSEVDVAGQWREIACFHGDVLSKCAVAVPVR